MGQDFNSSHGEFIEPSRLLTGLSFMAFNRGTIYTSLPEEEKRRLPSSHALDLMPAELVREFRAFVFEAIENLPVKIAALSPENQSLRQFARTRLGEKIEWFKAENEDIEWVLQNIPKNIKADIDALTRIDGGTNGSITKIVDRVLKGALEEKASDIHIEPLRTITAIRYRVDGILHTVSELPREMHPSLVARLKILANLKIDEYRRPQDGRIEPEDMPHVSFRISTIPTLYGEKAALRLLNDSHKNFSAEKLGFSKENEETLLRNVEKPFGMIVTSGPTGSGKTTTLYALLSLLRKEGINVSTLEDPVEYSVAGVNQIQVNPRFDFTFASGLRSLLRQDPDVIMVGEIRDSETAVMASNAALTGHLVLTTIHTNDAPSVFSRFLEMKVEDFVAASIINLVIAQRLVRKICDSCSVNKKLDLSVIKKIEERGDVIKTLEKTGRNMGVLGKTKFKIGRGCDLCFKTGYNSRIGIFELLELNKEIHDLALEHASAGKIREAAEKHGFKDMLEDGIEKIFAGLTTFEEVMRVTKSS